VAFSFADLGFWRVAAISFALELLHLILQGHWPAIRGSKLGPRTGAATLFMLLELLAFFIALAAALGTITRMGRAAPRPMGQIASVALTAMGLLGLFFFAWQK
jgi:hypothetical protein